MPEYTIISAVAVVTHIRVNELRCSWLAKQGEKTYSSERHFILSLFELKYPVLGI